MKIKINEEKFKKVLKEKGVKKTYLCQKLGMSSRTMAKISSGKEVTGITVWRIMDFLQCPIEDIYDGK